MSRGHSIADRVGYAVGVLVRGIVIGLALAAAIATMWAWSGSARVFRYEAF